MIDNRDKQAIDVTIENLEEEIDHSQDPHKEVAKKLSAELEIEDEDETPTNIDQSEEQNVESEKPVEPEKPAEVVTEPDKPNEELKTLYKHSTSEALILNAKNKSLVKTVTEAAELPEPTEIEVQAFAQEQGAGEWGTLSLFEKNMLKQTLLSRKQFAKVHESVIESQQVDQWADKVDGFVATESNKIKYPALQGREKEFITFCMKPTHRGADFELLATSFTSIVPARSKRGSLLATGNGGDAPQNKTEYSEDDIRWIRVNRPKLYKEMIKKGKVNISV